MSDSHRTILAGLFLAASVAVVKAKYTDTMDPNGLRKDLKTDFGLVDDNAASNQSDLLQKAIDAISATGGGRLVLPKGTYRFSGIYMMSNVHLLIERGAVIKPYWPKGKKTVVFTLGVRRDKKEAYIENVSIRGLGGLLSFSLTAAIPTTDIIGIPAL
jgi:hypothetical protein